MSEFMGMVCGVYDGKEGGFQPGGARRTLPRGRERSGELAGEPVS